MYMSQMRSSVPVIPRAGARHSLVRLSPRARNVCGAPSSGALEAVAALRLRCIVCSMGF